MLTRDKTTNQPTNNKNPQSKPKTKNLTQTNRKKLQTPQKKNPTDQGKNRKQPQKSIQNSEILATPQQPFNQVIQADARQKSIFHVHIIW